jgi:hypothetical protein
MTILQTGATIILLTMIMYFIMVNVFNVFEQPTVPLISEGLISSSIFKPITEATVKLKPAFNPTPKVLESRAGVSESPGTGASAELGSSLYNVNAHGVLPLNHDRFDAVADFTSDLTNINQFYKNNPELFHKSTTYVPNVADWDQKGQEMVNKILGNQNQLTEIQPANFETNFTSL